MKYVIRKASGGQQDGLYTLAQLKPDEVIMDLQGEIKEIANRYSIQIGTHSHLYPPQESDRLDERYAWRFLNHHCLPNTYIEDQKLKALGVIEAHAELTFNYLANEWEMESPFSCWCSQHSETRLVQGYRFLSNEAREELKLQTKVATHLKTLEQIG